jgi:retron-type reverse transcriptase
MTIEELLDDSYVWRPGSSDKTITYTLKYERTPAELVRECPVDWYIDLLRGFNDSTEDLRKVDRASLYETFYIPKSSGGMRRIDAPLPELKDALTVLKSKLEGSFKALYHTCAFAYIHGRSTVDAVKRHQSNESNWFGKLDLHDFFGSTTLDFVMNQLAMIYPFSEVIKRPDGKAELSKALELGFLNGGLPQGTPLSPTLTNIMMIPVDYELSKALRSGQFENMNFVYTRYADDFHISSRKSFSIAAVQNTIIEVLKSFNAPFSLNQKKTRYGSRNGKNWMLGVMLNGDNNITIGHKKKDQLRASLTNFARDYKNGNSWSSGEIMYVLGLHSYYLMVEEAAINGIVGYVNRKVGMDTISTMKSLLNT